jgi:hypothetical protein
MRVMNVHERELNASLEKAGVLIDRLASKDDLLWPCDRWPAMRFDRPLGVGAVGGHGPIRYVIDGYEPGQSICFRFTKPDGFVGTHRFELNELSADRVTLSHVIEMKTEGSAGFQWYFAVKSLHNALLEDALDCAEAYIDGKPRHRNWPPWVRFLRWTKRRGRSAGTNSRVD